MWQKIAPVATHLLVVHVLPVDGGKEAVTHNLLGVVWPSAESVTSEAQQSKNCYNYQIKDLRKITKKLDYCS